MREGTAASLNGAARKPIVIWGPDRPAGELALFAFALEELPWEVLVVNADSEGELFGLKARFVKRANRKAAAVIVDATLCDPSEAVGLAEFGVPLAVSDLSGAHEYVNGVIQYVPTSYRSILAAALAGFGANPPVVRAKQEPGDPDLSAFVHTCWMCGD